MLVKDIMTKKVVTCSPEETISSVLSKMEKYNLHQLPVIDDGEIKGIITLNRIIRHEVDPAKAKVRSLMTNTPLIGPDESIEKAIDLILNSNLRAIPVYDGQLKGIVSEEDLLNNIRIDSIEEGKKCIYVNENDTVGKVRKIMYENDVSRVPVMGEKGFVGIVRSFDFIKFLRAKQKYESYAQGLSSEESVRMDDILVKTIMSKPVVVKKLSASQILKKFKGNEDVLVNGCIITPKDILRAYVKKRKVKPNIIIIGEKNEEIYKECENLINKISHAVNVHAMKIHTESHHRKKKIYSIRIQLVTDVGTFISTKAIGWDLLSVVQDSLKKVEREFWKKYKRIKK